MSDDNDEPESFTTRVMNAALKNYLGTKPGTVEERRAISHILVMVANQVHDGSIDMFDLSWAVGDCAVVGRVGVKGEPKRFSIEVG